MPTAKMNSVVASIPIWRIRPINCPRIYILELRSALAIGGRAGTISEVCQCGDNGSIHHYRRCATVAQTVISRIGINWDKGCYSPYVARRTREVVKPNNHWNLTYGGEGGILTLA